MSLMQWNSEDGDFRMNMRLHFIYRLGSVLFLVYNERRLVEGFATGVRERSIALK